MCIRDRAYALASKSFRWEGFASVADLRNQIAGGVLMGVGAVSYTHLTLPTSDLV